MIRSLVVAFSLLALRTMAADAYRETVTPILQSYCFSCHGNGKHKGDLSFDDFGDESTALAHPKTWEKVLRMIQAHEMPPPEKKQPSAAERDALLAWIEAKVFRLDCAQPDPGRVTIRRLNRNEYNNTIRDLIGVDVKPAADFPPDDSGYGFDNIGDALSLPPILIEKYLASARRILRTALRLEDPSVPTAKRYPIDLLEVGYNAKQQGDGWVALTSIEEDDVAVYRDIEVECEFLLKVRAYGKTDSTNAMRLAFEVDKKMIRTIELPLTSQEPFVYEHRVKVQPGRVRFAVVAPRIKDGLSEKEAAKWKNGPNQKGTVFVEYLELEGPLNARPQPLPETHRRIFTHEPKLDAEEEAARVILGNFARRAYRRPVTPEELSRLTRLAKAAWGRGEGFVAGVQVALQAILVSPHFLFRGEIQPEPDNPRSVHPVNEYALASRLSYFFWNSMPDEELFAQAARGTLRQNLIAQAERMWRDPKARALTENFAGQWLQIRNLGNVAPDPRLFQEFDPDLRLAMQKETELFFEHILQENRSVLDFLNAGYSFVNERLARHYRIPDIAGGEFRRVDLRATPRRGLLGHASILALTSNPTRTSPVKRGKWVLENLLDSPPPPPPAAVPELSEDKEKMLSGTLRERMEQHRSNPACASCHARMDPIGFGLENFNAIGGWREEEGKFPIDPSGSLISGESFRGPGELAGLLAEKRRTEFVRCLASKLLIYALGRGLEYYDKCAVDQIVAETIRNDCKFQNLILAVIQSAPFQMRRGEGDRMTANH